MNHTSISQYTTSDRVRFLTKVEDASDPNACWIWQGAKHGQGRGYGKIWLNGKCVSAHRAAYLLFEGPIEAGMVLNHMCVNERCANPHHLAQCSQSDNIAYSVICGTHNSCR